MTERLPDAVSPASNEFSGAPVRRRVVALFTGFEPLDAEAHRLRFQRTAAQTSKLWNCAIDVGGLEGEVSHPYFDVQASGPDWSTQTRVFVLDHNAIIAGIRFEGLLRQIVRGFGAFFRVVTEGGLFGYFRWAWRFGLFFLFPFLVMASGIAISAAIAVAPLLADLSPAHLVWSVPAGFVFFRWLFLRWSDRFHTLHLFANWRLAVSLSRMDDPAANARLDQMTAGLRAALTENADEYLIASHSMGTNLATHTLGTILQRDAQTLNGKRVVFATFGGALLQCALLRSAEIVRRRAGRILKTSGLRWYEVQSLTDPVHFFKAPVATASGNPDAPAPSILPFRVKRVLTPDHYRRIKRDFLRVHRQYVLGCDLRAPYDFGLIVAGPLPASSFTEFSHDNLPPLGVDGSMSVASAT